MRTGQRPLRLRYIMSRRPATAFCKSETLHVINLELWGTYIKYARTCTIDV